MPRFSVTFDDEDDAYLADLATDKAPHDSKAEAVRAIVRDHREGTTDEPEAIRQEYETKLAELEAAKNEEIENLDREIDRLNRERRQLLEQREEHTELVRFAEEQRSVVRVREEREQSKEAAPAWRRGWWWLFGRSDTRDHVEE